MKIELVDGQTIHKANLIELEQENVYLSAQLKDATKSTGLALSELETQLNRLQLEQSNHDAALKDLEARMVSENREKEQVAEEHRLRSEMKAEIKAKEEKEHFAALWIQLRWKAHVRRQMKLAASKKKSGGKKKGKK